MIGAEDTWKLVIPEEHRNRVLKDAHGKATAGHLGIEKTYERVAQDYCWCDDCQRYKIDKAAPKGPMRGRLVECPWAVSASDLMEFPQSKDQYKYVVVFQDLFTRWVELRPLRLATRKNVAKAVEKLVLFWWGAPDYLLTDNGKEFDKKDLERILEVYGVTRVTTPPYHPQANPVERSNRILKSMIATFAKSDHRSWDQYLHEFRHETWSGPTSGRRGTIVLADRTCASKWGTE